MKICKLNLIFSQPTISDCTFTQNQADAGGAIFSFSPPGPSIANCILWHDLPDELGGSAVAASSCCIEGGYPGAGNLDLDPMFVLAPAPGLDAAWGTSDDIPGDLALTSGSPCIDAGDNTAVPAGVDQDLDGGPRFLDDASVADTGIGPGPIVDIGAHEK